MMLNISMVWILVAVFAKANLFRCAFGHPIGNASIGSSHPMEPYCVLFQKDIKYEDGSEESMWCCEIEHASARLFSVNSIVCELDGVEQEYIEQAKPVSGDSYMKAEGASIVQVSTGVKIVFPGKKNSVTFGKLSESESESARYRKRRKLAPGDPTVGVRETLVVMVVDGAGVTNTDSISQFKNDIFEDPVCLKTQYEACSKNQLIIQPASVGDGGVVVVKIDIAVAGSPHQEVENAVVAAAQESYGGPYGLGSLYDLVLFCLPPGDEGWLAYAMINGYQSFYNDYWCQRVSAQMHETGHNLNLGHSSLGDVEYGDTSDMMGFSFNDDDHPQQCFNAAKNYQLGWYNNQRASIDPLNLPGGRQTFTLTGIDEYQATGTSDKLVTLRLEMDGDLPTPGKDYYIGFNLATGPNAGTTDAVNKVAVMEKPTGGPNNIGASNRLAALDVGETYAIENFKGLDDEVYIKYLSRSGNDAIIEIVISTTAAPTGTPTRSCGGSLGRFQFEIQLDYWAADNPWSLREKDGAVIASATYTYGHNYDGDGDKRYVYPAKDNHYCLTPGSCYELQIEELSGDNMCCGYGEGYYKGFLDTIEIFGGGDDMQFMNIHEFCVDAGPPAPTIVPNPNPPPPMVAPTRVPVTPAPVPPPTVAPTQVPITPAPVPAPTVAPTIAPVTPAPAPPPTVAPTMILVTPAPIAPPTVAPTQVPVTPAPVPPPSVAPTQVPVTPAPISCGDAFGRFQFEIRTDYWASDNPWSLREKDGAVIASATYIAGPSGDGGKRYVYPAEDDYYCLTPGSCYELQIEELWGNNMCCATGEGYYKGFLDTIEIFGGGDNMQLMNTHEFCIEAGAPAPAPAPTIVPNPNPPPPPVPPPTMPPKDLPVTPVPPPTAAPTMAPVPPPTVAPTRIPVAPAPAPVPPPTVAPTQEFLVSTLAPTTASPTPPTVSCVDDEAFRFRSQRKKSCKRWIAKFATPLTKKNKRKIRKRCRKRYKGENVYELCRESCALVRLGPCAASAASAVVI